MATEKPLPREVPPPETDSWKPHHRGHKRPYGLVVIAGSNWSTKQYEWVNWYATERARNDAISAANKQANSRYLPVIALAKIAR